MIIKIATIFLVGLVGASAQRGLQDIPDPDPQKQKAAFNLPKGMKIELFASDPMISKPVQMNFDSAGRLWLVSSKMYPHIRPGAEENDQVIIIEDTNGDGKADKKTVFADDLHIPTAVQPADGGVYVANSTEILFLKDTDGDGKADTRKVLLSGFGTEDTHHLVHTFEQGPDGLLYFLQSIYIHSHLETPYGVRRLLGGGVWHYRPETGRAEVLSKGLINPWGFIFDDYGQTFATDGAGGEGINYIFPRSVYVASKGAKRKMRGLNPGQPKLCGLEALSGSHVPENMRGMFISPDFRGHRINTYKLEPNGSSYTSTRIDDFLSSSHRAFRPVDVKMGPDGALYIADWYNPIIQHGEVDFRDERRDQTRGRIWRVTFEGRPLVEKIDFTKLDVSQLLGNLLSKERVHRDFARAELRSRGRKLVLPELKKWSAKQNDDFSRLQALWTHQAINDTNLELVKSLLGSSDPRYRAAALRVVYHRHADIPKVESLVSKYVTDKNAQVRLWAISCLAQIPSKTTVPLALKALDLPVDEALDFALWSIVREHEACWVPQYQHGKDIFESKIKHLIFALRALGKPLSLSLVFKALSEGKLKDDKLDQAFELIAEIGSTKELAKLLDFLPANPQILRHLITAKKMRKLQPEKGLEKILPLLDSKDREIFSSAAELAGLWKLAAAREKLLGVLKSSPAQRKAAASGLRYFGGKQAVELFTQLSQSEDLELKILAVRELASLDPAAAAPLAVELLQKDDGKDRHGLFALFLRKQHASKALAKALKDKELPPKIASLGVQRAETSGKPPKELIAALKAAGKLKPMTQKLGKKEMDAMVKRVRIEGKPHKGEEIYRRVSMQCIACHAIGGVGPKIGPDLVSIGASAPIDYLITSMLDPNDKIKEGYHTTVVSEKNGTVHTGALVSEDEKQVVIRDFTGKEIKVAKGDVQSKIISPVSMMPPGLTASLREDEFIDLIRFLSELGKEGEFKTGPRPFVREWQVLQSHKLVNDQVRHYGAPIFAQKTKGFTWGPYYSKVNGSLDPKELPHGVVRFGLPNSLKGKAQLKFNDTKGLRLFDGKKEIAMPTDETNSILVPAGGSFDRFTLVVSKRVRKDPVALEILKP